MWQVEAVAKAIGESESNTVLAALVVGIVMGAVFIADRALYIWKNIRNKPNGTISQAQWSILADAVTALVLSQKVDADKIQEIHEWYCPDKPGRTPPFTGFLPWEEFQDSQERAKKAYEDNTAATHMLISTLKIMQDSALIRDQEIKKNADLVRKNGVTLIKVLDKVASL